jgi:Mg2+ and Co2+ transporter CorA
VTPSDSDDGRDETVDALRTRAVELELAIDWYLARIVDLEAHIAQSGDRQPGDAGAPRPNDAIPPIVREDDANRRQLERIKLFETELEAFRKQAAEKERMIAALAKTAEERLTEIARLDDACVELRAALSEKEAAKSALERTLDEVAKAREAADAAAAERLSLVEELVRDRDAQAEAAAARLALIDELERERALQAQTAAERLVALDAMERDFTSRLKALEERDAAQRSTPRA